MYSGDKETLPPYQITKPTIPFVRSPKRSSNDTALSNEAMYRLVDTHNNILHNGFKSRILQTSSLSVSQKKEEINKAHQHSIVNRARLLNMLTTNQKMVEQKDMAKEERAYQNKMKHRPIAPYSIDNAINDLVSDTVASVVIPEHKNIYNHYGHLAMGLRDRGHSEFQEIPFADFNVSNGKLHPTQAHLELELRHWSGFVIDAHRQILSHAAHIPPIGTN